MIIETECPPHPLPLTVAGVAAKFVSPPKPVDSSTSNARSEPVQDARPIKHSTNYAGMRGPKDPLHFAFPKWIRPTDDQLKSLVDALFQLCNPRLVHILCPWIIVELCCDDDRVYESGSLPRKIGGYAVIYHHSLGPAFEGLSQHGRRRIISPTAIAQDTSNYLDDLCPGVRVESETLITSVGQTSISSTAGLLVRNIIGHQRSTVSNRGFLNSDKVFHPSFVGTQIGKIDERWESLNIALVELDPSVKFTNGTYFEARSPKRLLRSQEIVDGDWYAVDGMSTGQVFLQAQGISLEFPRRPPLSSKITFRIWTVYRMSGGTPQEGVCGAAFVEDDGDGGGVAGFFQDGNADFAMSPCLDEFIDRSWNVVQAA